jgi:Sec7-like guanine-nucleotide exchange factor
MFTSGDLKNLQIIHHLLKEERMTMEGVRKKLSGKWEETDKAYEINESLLKIKGLLLDLRDTI